MGVEQLGCLLSLKVLFLFAWEIMLIQQHFILTLLLLILISSEYQPPK